MDVAYHYTSPDAALLILQNKTLRFTDCEFLNDPSEMAYCCGLLESIWLEACDDLGVTDALEKLGVRFCSDAYEDIYLTKATNSENAHVGTPVRSYVFCASQGADCIDMWNGFSKTTSGFGYALGLDADVLERELEKLRDTGTWHKTFDVRICPVLYDRSEQMSVIMRLLGGTVEHIVSEARLGSIEAKMTSAVELRSDLLSLAENLKVQFKSPVFRNEREIRAVIEVSQEYLERSHVHVEPKFRVGASGVMTPFLEWDFSSCAYELVRNVQLSPYLEMDVAGRGMKRMLRRLGYSSTNVLPSEVRLRF